MFRDSKKHGVFFPTAAANAAAAVAKAAKAADAVAKAAKAADAVAKAANAAAAAAVSSAGAAPAAEAAHLLPVLFWQKFQQPMRF